MTHFAHAGIFALLLTASLGGCAAGPRAQSDQAAVAAVPAADLKFEDFYQRPVGPYGLQPSARLQALDGQRVRIVGYRVDEQEPTSGVFKLAPVPVQLAEQEDGPADDLPGATVFVHAAQADAGQASPFQPGPQEVVGRLELGAREEADGRVSYVRLLLDAVAPAEVPATAARLSRR
jgi:hypothetical protein